MMNFAMLVLAVVPILIADNSVFGAPTELRFQLVGLAEKPVLLWYLLVLVAEMSFADWQLPAGTCSKWPAAVGLSLVEPLEIEEAAGFAAYLNFRWIVAHFSAFQ